jgi:hypothetical protein
MQLMSRYRGQDIQRVLEHLKSVCYYQFKGECRRRGAS